MGRRTKFFLGYELNGKLVPLNFLDNNLELIEDKLSSIINYTTSFDNELQLRNAITQGPMKVDIPNGAKLVYLASTNNPEYPYRKVLDTNHICYAMDQSLRDAVSQSSYFKDNRYDIFLFQKLYKIALMNNISMSELRSFCPDDQRKNLDLNLMIRVFNENRDKIGNGNNTIFNLLNELLSEITYANQIGIINYEYDPDRIDLDYKIDVLYDMLTLLKDKNKQPKHDPNTGMLLRDDKMMGYLTILISQDMMAKYIEYSNELQAYALEHTEEEHESNDVYRDVEGHDEEFLTTEDFNNISEDPESVGYMQRKSGI